MAVSSAMTTDNVYVKYTISVTQNSQNVTNNASNVTVSVRFYRTNTGYTTYGTGTVYCKINGTKYSASVTPSDKITNSGIVLFSKTLNIPHNADGSKSLTCSAWIDHNALLSEEQSYTQTLTTIPRKSTISDVSASALGSQSTITVTQQSASFTHSLKYTCGTASGYITSSGGTSSTESKYSTTTIKWTPPASLASQNTKGTSLTVKLTLTTYNGSTKIGSVDWTSYAYYIPEALVRPTPALTVTDAMGYGPRYGSLIQGQSKLSVSVAADGLYGASIRSYNIVVTQGKSVKTYSQSSFTTDFIASTDDVQIDAVVEDSRGVSSTKGGSMSTTLSVLPYSVPKFSGVSVKRCDYAGVKNKGLQVTFSADVLSMDSKNTAAYSLQYKKASEASYSNPVAFSNLSNVYDANGQTYTFPADVDASYNILLKATDSFTSTTKVVNGPPARKLWSVFTKGMGLAIGKVAELSEVFDVAWKAIFRGDVCVGNKTGHLDGKTGVYVNKDGYMHIQRSTGEGHHPYIGFFLDDSTAADGQIRINSGTGVMEFKSADGYDFGNNIHGAANLSVGAKEGSQDGNTGVYVSKDGYVQVQRDSSEGNPYIGFYVNDSTSPDGQIQVNSNTGVMEFRNADGYDFGNTIHGAVHLSLGNKTADSDGKSGVFLSSAGYMQLHRSTTPYIQFFSGTATTPSGSILYNPDGDCMNFAYSGSYLFNSHIHTKESIKIGYEQDATKQHYIGAYWKDGAHHFLLERGSDGLTTALGWAGSATYPTVTKIRGQTCQYQNASGTSTLSDERLKKDFTSLDKWGAFFNALEPCAFKMKAGTSGRYHMGFKAQQVEQALLDAGLTTQDFAGFIKMKYEEDIDDPARTSTYEEAGIKPGDDEYGLIYSEFVALNTYKIQQLQKENDELKLRVAKLEALLNVEG